MISGRLFPAVFGIKGWNINVSLIRIMIVHWKENLKDSIYFLMPDFSICDCQRSSLRSVTVSYLPADSPSVVIRWQICHVPGGTQVIIYVGHNNSKVIRVDIQIQDLLHASAPKWGYRLCISIEVVLMFSSWRSHWVSKLFTCVITLFWNFWIV